MKASKGLSKMLSLGKIQAGTTKKTQFKITTIFFVALAIRKFQKFLTVKFKKSLSFHFDKQDALNELKQLDKEDGSFFAEHFNKLVYFIRKFNLTFDDFEDFTNDTKTDPGVQRTLGQRLFQHLQRGVCMEADTDKKTLLFLCLALKHLTQNSSSNEKNPLEISTIIVLIKSCKDHTFIGEIVMLLACWLGKSSDMLNNDTISELKTLVLDLPELNADVNAFFLARLESKKSTHTAEKKEGTSKPKRSTVVPKVRKNQQVVSKTIQTVKSKQEAKNSEEADFKILDLSARIKSQNRKLKCNTEPKPMDTADSQNGSDRSMWRSTWGETVNLFSLVSQGQVLKDDDKDNYLPDKFFGTHHILNSGSPLSIGHKFYSFFINKMCASIFLKVSRKQQLNSKAVDKLLKCVTDFDGLLSALKIQEDFVTFIVDAVFQKYWELKAMTGPDILVMFVKEIMRRTTEEFENKGWFYSTTDVRKKSYDREEIKKIVRREINLVRQDAINALYNCAVRDKKNVLTKKVVQTLQAYVKKPKEDFPDCKKFVDFVYKLFEIADSLDDFDYPKTFEIYLSKLRFESQENVDVILRFMHNQVRDKRRSKELFTDNVMETLLAFADENEFRSAEKKPEVLEMIRTYLQHEHNQALSDRNLEKLLESCFQSGENSLINSGLAVLLLSLEKSHSIAQCNLSILMKKFEVMSTHNEECTSFIVFILSRVFCTQDASNQSFLKDPRLIELVSSKLSCSHVVNLEQDDELVKIGTPDAGMTFHNHAYQIAFLAANMILTSVERKVIVSSATIDNLLLVLESLSEEATKQTQILAAKTLYNLTTYVKFDVGVLNQLLNLINCPTYDASVYIQTAYVKSCVKVAFTPAPELLNPIHLEHLSDLYVHESLKLGQEDYEMEINTNLFKTLLYEGKKQEFNDEIFLLFDTVLELNQKYASQVLAILKWYSFKFTVPEATVRTVEKLLAVPGYHEEALLIAQNVILNGKSNVSSKTLAIFIDHLFVSSNTHLRVNSFKLLEEASKNMDLPEDLFWRHELVRAGFAFELGAADKSTLIDFIQFAMDRGMKLPVDTQLALEKEITDTRVLRIFSSASRNKQIVPQQLLQVLIKLFEKDPKTTVDVEKDILVVSIFENAVKSNLTLPQDLLVKLQEALKYETLEPCILKVFIYLAQKGDKLSPETNNKLLDKLLTEQNPVLKQELLSCLGSLIDANRTDIIPYLQKVNQILIQQISSDNINIQKLCISAIHKLVIVCERIDEVLLEKLVDIGVAPSCHSSVKNEINLLFGCIKDEHNPVIHQKQYRKKVNLANLQCSSPKELMSQLKDYICMSDGLLNQNFLQLKCIIDNENVQLQEEALSLLHLFESKDKFADELLESVAILADSTVCETLRKSCLQLLNKVVESGKTLSGRALHMWDTMQNHDANVQIFLQGSLCTELKMEFELTDETLKALHSLVTESAGGCKINGTAEFLNLIVGGKSDYVMNQSFVLLVEQCLLKKKYLEVTLPCFCRIIKERKCTKVVECVQALVQHFCEDEEDLPHLHSRLFEAMYHAQKFQQLPDICLEVAMENLECLDGTIRGYSFGILRCSKEEKCKQIVNEWCDSMLVSLAEILKVEIKKTGDFLDLMEIMMSLKIFDVGVLLNAKREMWIRELLTSSILLNFNVLQMEQLEFYTRWHEIEEKFTYHKSCKILEIMQKCDFDNFSQLLELISIIPDMNFDDVFYLLNIHSPEPSPALKHHWCIIKINAHCSQRGGITDKYAKEIAGKLCSRFNTPLLNELFSCLQSIDNLAAFEDLANFCSEKKIVSSDIEGVKCVHVRDLMHHVQVKHLMKCTSCQPKSDTDKNKFLETVRALDAAGWNFNQLCQLVEAFNPPVPFNNFSNLLNMMSTIQAYSLFSLPCIKKCIQITTETQVFQEILQKIHQLAIENHFQMEGKVKDLNELLAEFKDKNMSEPALEKLKEGNSLNIQQCIFQEQSEKFNWNEKQIYLWAKGIKSGKIKEFSDHEAIAVILRANFLITGYELTNTQILCSLVALKNSESMKGKLLEVATGEGKSTIISILAIINALRGNSVDILTSSPVLAERDAKQQAKLYRLFGLSCSDNNDKIIYLKGGKDCYLSDIVYGEMSQFQFDILRDNYSKLGTLCGRKFSVAIVDEVDSMLIDDSSKIARLSSTVPGMDHFHALYVFIWQRLVSIRNKFIMCNGKLYFVYGTVNFENGNITSEYADEKGNVMKITDLEALFAQLGDLSPIGEVVEDVDEFLRKLLIRYLDDQMQQNRIYIPSNFADFVQKQKSKWITNAVEALNYQENVHYVVQNGEIKPVDYHSTGIVQSSTNWSDGLHQFLQLKHNLKMTSETLTTNFLSNVGLMKKYEHVCGLTGTLGSDTARGVLRSVYKVDLFNIPQKRKKQFLQLDSIVAMNEDSWLEEIMSNIVLETQKDRGILVVCETIENASQISDMLNKKLPPTSVKLYTMNDTNQEKNVERILPGQVIIATNLAGRGTDIKTDEIEATGGLHVILTFMPPNQRVEDQAFGRTARQGKRGTGVMILNARNMDGYSTTTTAVSTGTMKAQRDEIEKQQLQIFRDQELELIQVKDKLFDTFCSFLNDEIRVKIRKKTQTKIKKLLNWFTDIEPTVYECCVLSAVEEQWAGFLGKLDDRVIKCEEAAEKCSALIDQLRNDFKNEQLIKNPYYFITIANDMLVNTWGSTTSNTKDALGYFQKAVELEQKWQQKKHDEKPKKSDGKDSDSEGSKSDPATDKNEDIYTPGAAHVGIAWCMLRLKEEGYKDKALASFKVALKCLAGEMSTLNAAQLLLNNLEHKQSEFENSPLCKQLNTKTTILGSYLNGINASINALKRSKRMLDLVAVKRHEVTSGEPCILETLTYYTELERNDEDKHKFTNENLKLNDEEIYSLTFNHLTCRQDSGTIDQAWITIDNAFDEKLLAKETQTLSKLKALSTAVKSKFSSDEYSSLAQGSCNIKINLNQVDLSTVSSVLFNPDQEFKDLTYETTLMKLKEKQSCLHYCRLTNSPKADLLIHSNDDINLKEQFNDKQINELLEIVKQKRNNPSLRFDIVFRKANENPLNSLFKSDNKSCSSSVVLHVEFQDLSQEAAQAKLQSVQARSVHVGVVLNKLDLKKLIELNKSLSSGKLLLNQSQVHEKLNMQQLLVQVEKLKTDHSFCYARFEDLTLDQAKSIVKNCNENAKFVLSFCDISDFYASELNEGQVNFSFDGLSQDSAKIVVRVLRNAHLEFSLEFKNLSDKEVRFILQHANLEQEAVEISKVKNVCDLFMKSSSPTFELNQFVCRGLEHIIEINEKLFVPWWSVTAVAALGVGQVLIGGVLMATGFGSSLGMGLVTEGVADVFIAFRAFKTRQFQWSDYCKQKAVSLAISAATMGYSKWKEGVQNAAKGVETLATGMAQEMAEQVGTQIISNSKVLGQVVLSTGKNMKSLAFKVVCTKAAEAVAREGMNTAIQNLSNFSFGLLKPKISESVQERVRMAFCHTELMRLLRKFYAIDLASGSHQLQSKVESIVADTVNPQRDFMQRQFDSICLPLIKGVLSDANRFGSHASLVIRMISTLNGLHQVTTLADTVVKAILQKLGSYDKNSMTMSLILHKSQKVPKLTAIVLAKKFKELEIFDENDGIGILDSDASESCGEVRAKIDALQSAWKTTPKQMLDELSGHLTDSSSLEADVTKSIVFIDHFYHKFVSIDLDSFNTIIKSVSDQISQQLVKVMDSQLLQPWSTLAVSGLTDAISKRLQHHIFVDERENSDSQKADESKYQELLKKQSLTAEEKAFIGKYGQFRTFAQQLDYNAKDFCTAYSQCEIYYHASRDGASSTPPDPNVQQMANSVRGGEPANLAVMAALAKNNGIKLKVVDDPNYVRSQEDIENGVEVMYVKEDPGSGVGHAFYMDSDGQIKDVKSEGYDCAFAAFSKILEGKGIEKSVSDLRAEIANSMESNSASFTKALAAETWIRKNNPEAAKNLFVAGLYKDSTTGRLKLEDGDVEKMITAMKNPKIKSDSKAGGYFKRMVRKRPGDETKEDRGDETEETLHHILPRAEITEAVIESQARNPTQFRKDFEEYINLPKIKRVFEEHLLVNTNVNADVDVPLKTPQFTGTILYNSVSWYSNNLVYGPAPEKRKNDPKNSLDTEILEVQTDAYQNASLTAWDAIKPDNDKRDFGQYLEAVKDLTPPDARWKKDQDGKYVAMPANTTANTTANTM